MLLLAHISDVHLAPLPSVSPVELLNKRLSGFLNWKINRARYMHRDTLSDLIAHLKQQNPDFTAISGDLVNLSLDAEFANAAKWVENLGPANKVAVIPGNHDAYIPGSAEKFRIAFGDYATGELLDTSPFPYVRRLREDVAVVGCSSAVATPPFFASGQFDAAQAERLEQCLTRMGEAGYFRVVMIHHPPSVEDGTHWRKGLYGADLFRKVVKRAGAELILHGHTHRASVNAIPGPEGEVPVVGVAAASADASSGDDPARYNLFSITRSGDNWTCDLREYGYRRIGDEIVLRLQMRIR